MVQLHIRIILESYPIYLEPELSSPKAKTKTEKYHYVSNVQMNYFPHFLPNKTKHLTSTYSVQVQGEIYIKMTVHCICDFKLNISMKVKLKHQQFFSSSP